MSASKFLIDMAFGFAAGIGFVLAKGLSAFVAGLLTLGKK